MRAGKFSGRSETGFFGEEARGLTPAPELSQKTMLLASNILAVPEGFAPDPVLKPSKERPGNPPALFINNMSPPYFDTSYLPTQR